MKKQVIGFVSAAACLHATSLSQTKNSATDWFDRAFEKYKRKDYQGAIAGFTRATKLEPDWAGAYNNRGLVYLMLNKKEKALADLMRAMELGYRVPQKALDMCK